VPASTGCSPTAGSSPTKEPSSSWIPTPISRTPGSGPCGRAAGRARRCASPSVALVVCNEVTLAPASRADEPGVLERIRHYRIDHHPAELYNIGAWRMLEELARVLAPGGVAVVLDRGSLDQQVEETVVRNRPEFNLHFGHLCRVAEALGLDAQFVPLSELLGFDLGAAWLARHSFEALRARMVQEGKILPARAWTAETLVLPWICEGIDWVSLREEGPGPLVTTHGALLLRK
jgi:hypothetical protein